MLQHIHVMLYLFSYHNHVIPFHLKTALSWWFNFATNNKTYLGLHMKSQILSTFGLSKQIFIESPISFFMEIHPLGFTLIHVDGQTDGYVKANRCIFSTMWIHLQTCPSTTLSTPSTYGLAWDWTWASAVRGQQLIAWPMAEPQTHAV